MLFPVIGRAQFSDDFGAPRPGGRKHEGNDIFAPTGALAIAADGGVVRFYQGPLGGNSLTVTTADGTRYYYAHLSGYAGEPRAVDAGELVGYVGNTGDAVTTSPHLHFEIHPLGGAAIDPYTQLLSATRLKAPRPAGGAGGGTALLAFAALLGGMLLGKARK